MAIIINGTTGLTNVTNIDSISSVELEYLNGVTSSIQTQLDGKSSTSHTHNYAGSSSAGGPANSINVFDTRTAQRIPNDYDNYTVQAEFTNQITGLTDWHSVMTLKGWTDGYANWQLIGGSTTSTHENLYFRSGINSSWNSLRTILHSGNYNNYALPKSGGTMTGQLSNTSNYPLVSKLSGYKSFTFHHSAANNLILAPSGSIDAEDWDWSKQIIFYDTSSMSLSGNISAGGTINASGTGTFSNMINVATSGTDHGVRIAAPSGNATGGRLQFTNYEQNAQWSVIETTSNLVVTVYATNGLTCTGNVTAYSDERLKSNIETIDNALDKVKRLRGVSFDKDGKRGIGVIAQEIQKILPEVVQENQDEIKTLSVAYGNMVGLLIEAIKEQQKQIEELKALVGK